MPNALRTTTEIKADIARKLHEAGRMTVTDPAYEDVHADLDRLGSRRRRVTSVGSRALTFSECRCGDERWHCGFGFHHVVPRLAQDCTGRAHGYAAQDPRPLPREDLPQSSRLPRTQADHDAA